MFKRMVSFLLAVVLLVGAVPAQAFAAETEAMEATGAATEATVETSEAVMETTLPTEAPAETTITASGTCGDDLT